MPGHTSIMCTILDVCVVRYDRETLVCTLCQCFASPTVDRRLDEWVHSERVDEVELLYQEESASLEELVALPQDDEEEQTGIEDRTITRGMKRKRGISEKLVSVINVNYPKKRSGEQRSP